MPVFGDCDFGGMCSDTGTGGERGVLHDLPVSKDQVDGIQPFGATVYAHGAGKKYHYCQHFHCGIDFFVEWGTPVQAGVYGTVIGIDMPYEGPYNIVIQSGDFAFKYGHLEGSEPPVGIGDLVSPDTIIGYSGNDTGDKADGNLHIHFEVRSPNWGGLTYNPETVMTVDVKQEYSDYISNQTGYPGGQYYNTRKKFTGDRNTGLPSESWWQTPTTIRRIIKDEDSTLWLP